MSQERSIPRDWRTRKQRYSLYAEVCNTCEKHIFPPRDVCPHCADDKRNWWELSEGDVNTEPINNSVKNRVIYERQSENEGSGI